jgi:hypothetical protein
LLVFILASFGLAVGGFAGCVISGPVHELDQLVNTFLWSFFGAVAGACIGLIMLDFLMDRSNHSVRPAKKVPGQDIESSGDEQATEADRPRD